MNNYHSFIIKFKWLLLDSISIIKTNNIKIITNYIIKILKKLSLT